MRRSFEQLRNEEGSVLLVALFILVILSLIGMSASSTTQVELQIAGNEQFHNIAFFNADSGVYATPKIITAAFVQGGDPTFPQITYLGNSGTFYREIMGFDPYDSARDLSFSLNGLSVEVDVNRLGQVTLPGGSSEFGSGAEGIGAGSAGGVGILYGMDSLGQGPGFSVCDVSAVYRKVIGVAGGL
jgi:hypothetical protein